MKSKRILAMILSGMMVLSMAACGSDSSSSSSSSGSSDDSATTADTSAADTASDDASSDDATASSTDFTWNGQKEVWAILPTTGVPGLLVHADSMGYVMDKYGFTYVAKDASTSSEIQLVEDAIAAGNVGCLMIATSDQAALEDVAGQAADAGIAIVYLGAQPKGYDIAGYVATKYSITGMAAVQAAEDWVQQRVAEGGDIPTNSDGKYEVALDTYYDIEDGVYRSNAMYGTADASELFEVISSTQAYGSAPQTDAYNNASTVLQAHPDCRIFIAYEPDEAIGISSYLEQYAADNSLDLADFCVIPCYSQDDTFMSMYSDAEADHSASAVKGYSTYGGDSLAAEADFADFESSGYSNTGMSFSTTGGTLAAILLGVCGEGDYTWDFGTGYFDDITAVNVYGYSYLWTYEDENPCENYEVGEALYE